MRSDSLARNNGTSGTQDLAVQSSEILDAHRERRNNQIEVGNDRGSNNDYKIRESLRKGTSNSDPGGFDPRTLSDRSKQRGKQDKPGFFTRVTARTVNTLR